MLTKCLRPSILAVATGVESRRHDIYSA